MTTFGVLVTELLLPIFCSDSLALLHRLLNLHPKLSHHPWSLSHLLALLGSAELPAARAWDDVVVIFFRKDWNTIFNTCCTNDGWGISCHLNRIWIETKKWWTARDPYEWPLLFFHYPTQGPNERTVIHHLKRGFAKRRTWHLNTGITNIRPISGSNLIGLQDWVQLCTKDMGTPCSRNARSDAKSRPAPESAIQLEWVRHLCT